MVKWTNDDARDGMRKLRASRVPDPPKKTKLPLVEWAPKHFTMRRRPNGVNPNGRVKWRYDRWKPLRYLSDFLAVADAKNGPRSICMWKAAQIGYSMALMALETYELLEKDANIVNILPHDQSAGRWGKSFIEPLFGQHKGLIQLFESNKNRTHGHGLHKLFDTGASIATIGGNTGDRYRSQVSTLIALDELDGYNDIDEGEPWALAARGVQNTGGNLIAGSTPTAARGESQIINAYMGQQTKFIWVIKCPVCGDLDSLVWERMVFDETGTIEERSNSAQMACGQCGGLWKHDQLEQAIEGGRWQEAFIADDAGGADKPLFPEPLWEGRYIDGGRLRNAAGKSIKWTKHIGLCIHGLYSIWHTWPEIVEKWLRAQGKTQLLQVFIEQTLARPFTGDLDPITPSVIRANAISIDQVSPDAKLVIAVIDVQNKWLSMNVFMFSSQVEGVMVDRREFHGDVEYVGSSAWLLAKEWLATDPKYRGYRIHMLAIDTGYSTDSAVRNGMRLGVNMTFFVKGMGGFDRQSHKRADEAKVQNSRYPLFILGVDPLKETVRKCLSVGLIRVLDTIPEDVDRELTSENLIRRRVNGKWTKRWEQVEERNEALDTLVYALASIRIAGMDSEMIARIQPAKPRRKVKRKQSSVERLRATGHYA